MDDDVLEGRRVKPLRACCPLTRSIRRQCWACCSRSGRRNRKQHPGFAGVSNACWTRRRLRATAQVRILRSGADTSTTFCQSVRSSARGHHKALLYDELLDFVGKLRTRDGGRRIRARIRDPDGRPLRRGLGRDLGRNRPQGQGVDRSSKPDESRAATPRAALDARHRGFESGQAAGRWIRRPPDAPVFPGQGRGKRLSSMSLAMLLRRRMKVAVTVHGFRSSFRDWAGEVSNFPREVAEAALAHTVGDATGARRPSPAATPRRSGAADDGCLGEALPVAAGRQGCSGSGAGGGA